jgi:hypothetical protein
VEAFTLCAALLVAAALIAFAVVRLTNPAVQVERDLVPQRD